MNGRDVNGGTSVYTAQVTSTTVISEAEYERIAFQDVKGHWERHRGRLRQKPPMTHEHNDIGFLLAFFLQQQLSLDEYHLRSDAGRARRPATGTNFIPDVMVIPVTYMPPRANQPGPLEQYTEPLPFVAEVWSPSTGDYDVMEKLPEYQARGDLDIWLVHPYERTITAWRRQPDGSYSETRYADGVAPVESLPGVSIEMRRLLS